MTWAAPWNFIFVGKDSMPQKSAFKHTIDDVVTKRWRHYSDWHALDPPPPPPPKKKKKKNKLARALPPPGWGRQPYLPSRLRGDMATPITIALDSSFNLLLISWLLVDDDGNCQHHVIIGINHGYVCVLLISTPACVVSPCRAIIDIPFLVKCFDCEVSAKFYIASLTIHRYC